MKELVLNGDFFTKCLPQRKLIVEIEDDVKTELLNWVGDEKAKVLFSKVPDVLVYDQNSTGINFEASSILHKIIDEQDLLNSVFYLSEKKLSVNNKRDLGAVCFWVINWFNAQPVIEPVFQEQVIDTLKIGNIYTWVKYRSNFRKLVKGDKVLDWIFELGSFGRSVSIGIFGKNGDLENEWNQWNWFLNQFPVDEKTKKFLKSQFDIYKNDNNFYLKDEIPFVAVKNNPSERGDIADIKTDIAEMVAIKAQKLLEIFLGGTKVSFARDTHNENITKMADNDSEIYRIYTMAMSPIITIDKPSMDWGGGTTNIGINYGQPVAETFERIEKAIKNRILQKVGAATDVDAKGTVQQTQSELTIIQGGQFRAVRWKKNDRQRCLTELFTKVAKIFKDRGDEQFKNFDKVQVIISQDEVVSEKNMLENMKLAEELGVSSKLINFARYNKLSIVDAKIVMDRGGNDVSQIKEIEPNFNVKENSL